MYVHRQERENTKGSAGQNYKTGWQHSHSLIPDLGPNIDPNIDPNIEKNKFNWDNVSHLDFLNLKNYKQWWWYYIKQITEREKCKITTLFPDDVIMPYLRDSSLSDLIVFLFQYLYHPRLFKRQKNIIQFNYKNCNVKNY